MEIEGSNTTLTNGSMKKDESNFDRYQKYPISLLRAPTEKLPNKVDPQRREVRSRRLQNNQINNFNRLLFNRCTLRTTILYRYSRCLTINSKRYQNGNSNN